jgi:HlyD family secretion protein
MTAIRRATRSACFSAWLIVLAGCLVLPTGCSGGSSRQEPTPTHAPTPIVPARPTYEVQRGEVVNTLEFRGRVAPVIEEELFFRSSGYVGTIYVERDEMVQAGDLLAELETTDLKNQLAQARADLEAIQRSAEQRLGEAQANLRLASSS